MRAGHVAVLVLVAIIFAAAALPFATISDWSSPWPEALAVAIAVAGFTALGAVSRRES